MGIPTAGTRWLARWRWRILSLWSVSNLARRVREEVGPYLAKQFERLIQHPLVGEAKTCGFVAGLVIVKNKATRVMFDPSLSVGMICRGFCFNNGLIMRAVGDRMIIAPPLVMTNADIDDMMRLIQRALDLTQQELRNKGICS